MARLGSDTRALFETGAGFQGASGTEAPIYSGGGRKEFTDISPQHQPGSSQCQPFTPLNRPSDLSPLGSPLYSSSSLGSPIYPTSETKAGSSGLLRRDHGNDLVDREVSNQLQTRLPAFRNTFSSSSHAYSPSVSSPLMQTTSPDNLSERYGNGASSVAPSSLYPLRERNILNQLPSTVQGGSVFKGWMHKSAPSTRKFHNRYFTLQSNKMLYYFKNAKDAAIHFGRDQRKQTAVQPRGQIDLSTVRSIKVCPRRNLPGGGKGIELYTPDRTWIVCPASEKEFIQWLEILSKLIARNSSALNTFAGTDELQKKKKERVGSNSFFDEQLRATPVKYQSNTSEKNTVSSDMGTGNGGMYNNNDQVSGLIDSSTSPSLIAGWLLQSKNHGRTWRRRYFNLNSNFVLRSSKEPTLNGDDDSIELHGDSILSIQPSLKCTRCLEIQHIDSKGSIFTMYLRASKASSFEAFYNVLSQLVQQHHLQMYQITNDPELIQHDKGQVDVSKMTSNTLQLYQLGVASHALPWEFHSSSNNSSTMNGSSIKRYGVGTDSMMHREANEHDSTYGSHNGSNSDYEPFGSNSTFNTNNMNEGNRFLEQQGQQCEGWLLYEGASTPSSSDSPLKRGYFLLDPTTGKLSLRGVGVVAQVAQDVVSVCSTLDKNICNTKQMGRKLVLKMRDNTTIQLWALSDGQKWYDALSSHALDYKIAHYQGKYDGSGGLEDINNAVQDQRSPQRQMADSKRGGHVTSGTKMYWVNIGKLYHKMMSKPSNLRRIASYRRFHPENSSSHQYIPSLADVVKLTIMTWKSGAPYFVAVVESLIHLNTMMNKKELCIHSHNWKTTLLTMLDVTQSLHTDGLTLDHVDELWMSCSISSTEMTCRLLWCNELKHWLNEKNQLNDGHENGMINAAMYEMMLYQIHNA